MACDIFQKETGTGGWETEEEREERKTKEGDLIDNSEYFKISEYSMSSVFLPIQVTEFYGTTKSIVVRNRGGLPSASAMNDNGSSFLEIADMIEQYYELT